jgi:hypothetical protein
MGYPNMKCMYVTVWVHNMQIDELFDYITGRIDMAPPFWYNHEECPYSVTGGYSAINLAYDDFAKLRSMGDWYEDRYDKSERPRNWDFPDWEDFVDEA